METQPSSILNVDYILNTLPSLISKDKYDTYQTQTYLTVLSNITNLTQLPTKTKEEIKTFISYLTHIKNEYYISLGTALLYINPLSIPSRNTTQTDSSTNRSSSNLHEKEYFSLKNWCISSQNFPQNEHPPHIYTIAYNAYTRMQSTNKDQTIILSGALGSGKTFNLNKIIQYLFFISSKNEINQNVYDITLKSIKLMQFVGSIFKKENIDSSSCGYVYHLCFNNELCFFDIDSEILDCTLPFSESGRSYSLLHSFYLTQSESFGYGKQIFNFFKKYFKNYTTNETHEQVLKMYCAKDIENWEMFLSLMEYFLNENEIEQVIKLLYVIILCNEVTILKNKRVVNGKKIETYFISRNIITKKIAKLLEIDEKKFVDCFIKCTTLQQNKTQLVAIMKYSYFCLHDFILSKIKAKLETFFNHSSNHNSNNNNSSNRQHNYIHIIDFPGQIKDETLGGLMLNYSYEFVNLLSYGNYTSVLSKLIDNELTLKHIDVPSSYTSINNIKHILQLLSTLHNVNDFNTFNFDNNNNNDTTVEYISNTNPQLKIKFSLTTVTYSILDLQMESLTLSPLKSIIKLLKSSKNDIYKVNNFTYSSNTTNEQISIDNYMNNKMKYLLCGLHTSFPFVVHCINYNEMFNNMNVIRNGIVHKALDWEWHGYHEWISVDDFVKEYNGDYEQVKMFFCNVNGSECDKAKGVCDNRNVCMNIIMVLSMEKECKVGKEFVVMKKGCFEYIRNIFKALMESITKRKESEEEKKENKKRKSVKNYISTRKIVNGVVKDLENKRKNMNNNNNNNTNNTESYCDNNNNISNSKSYNSNSNNANTMYNNNNKNKEHIPSNQLITVTNIMSHSNTTLRNSNSLLLNQHNYFSIDNLFNHNSKTPIDHDYNNINIQQQHHNNIPSYSPDMPTYSSNNDNTNNYSNLTLSSISPYITLLQSKYRGYIIRKNITFIYRYIKHNIILLQKNIRGFLLRLRFYKFLECFKRIITIQIYYKERYETRTLAAIRLQRFFRKKLFHYNSLTTNTQCNVNTHSKHSKSNAIDLPNETDKDKIIKCILLNKNFVNESKYNINDNYKNFNPNLYGYLHSLQYNNNNNTDRERVEDRLLRYGKNIRIKQLQKISEKANNELNDYTFHPQLLNTDFVFIKNNRSFYRNNKPNNNNNNKINQ